MNVYMQGRDTRGFRYVLLHTAAPISLNDMEEAIRKFCTQNTKCFMKLLDFTGLDSDHTVSPFLNWYDAQTSCIWMQINKSKTENNGYRAWPDDSIVGGTHPAAAMRWGVPIPAPERELVTRLQLQTNRCLLREAHISELNRRIEKIDPRQGDAMEAKVKDLEDHKKKLEDEKKKLQETVERLQREQTTSGPLVTRVRELEAEVRGHESARDTLFQQLAVRREETNRQKAEVERLEREKQRLRRDLERLENQDEEIRELQEKNEKQEEELRAFRRLIDAFNTRVGPALDTLLEFSSQASQVSTRPTPNRNGAGSSRRGRGAGASSRRGGDEA
jgi:myosin heavy subunit